MLAAGGALHCGGAALPLSAPWEAVARVAASVKVADSEALTIQVQPMLEPVAALRAGLDAHEALVARVGGVGGTP